MLDKENIINKLKALDLPIDQYCIMTGAALVLHGVKEYTRDIDIGCTELLFNRLLQICTTENKKNDDCIVIDDCVEIYKNWLPKHHVYIEGIPAADIPSIREYKQQLARDKDIRDIELIDAYFIKQKKTKDNIGE